MKSFILRDHDGVLVETEPWYFEATRQCIRELGVDSVVVANEFVSGQDLSKATYQIETLKELPALL